MSAESKPAANIKYINIKMKKKLKNNSEIIYIIKDAGELCVKILLFLLCCENPEKIDFEYMKNNVRTGYAGDDEILKAVDFWKEKNILDYEITSSGNVRGPNMENIINIILNISRDINLLKSGGADDTESDDGLGIYTKKNKPAGIKKHIKEPPAPEEPEPEKPEEPVEPVEFEKPEEIEEAEETEGQETAEIKPPDEIDPPKMPEQPVSIDKLIESFETKEEFRRLIHESQIKMQTTFNTADLVIMYNLYEVNNMETDLILKLAEMCVEEDKNNIRYLEKYALGVAANGILTVAEYEDRIREMYKIKEFEDKIKKIFNIVDKKLSTKEKSFIRKWAKEFDFTDDMFLEGYKRCIKYKGKFIPEYINTTYEAWNQKGFKSLDDITGEHGSNGNGFSFGNTAGSRKNAGFNMDDLLEKAVKKGVKF